MGLTGSQNDNVRLIIEKRMVNAYGTHKSV